MAETPLHDSQGSPVTLPSRGTRRLLARIREELRNHVYGYAILAIFTLAGPVVMRFLFPEASLAVGLVGGLAFGVYAAICTIPNKFM
jgi:hypothetical protein